MQYCNVFKNMWLFQKILDTYNTDNCEMHKNSRVQKIIAIYMQRFCLHKTC